MILISPSKKKKKKKKTKIYKRILMIEKEFKI